MQYSGGEIGVNNSYPLAHRSEQASYEGTTIWTPFKRGCQGQRVKRDLTPRISVWYLVQLQNGQKIFSCSLSGKTTVSGTVVLGSSPDGRKIMW